MYKKLENIVFLGSKKFGLNILKELYSKNKKLNWLVIHTNDKDDNRSYLNHFLVGNFLIQRGRSIRLKLLTSMNWFYFFVLN